MASQIGPPIPDLTDTNRAYISTELDAALNSRILYSLLLGLYTGIVVVTLESIYTNKTRTVGRGMAAVISTLYIISSVNFFADWAYTRTLFVGNGQSAWAEYLFANSDRVGLTLVMGVAGIVCTALADSALIWRCWTVWGRRWPVIVPPVLFLICTIVFNCIAIYKAYTSTSGYTFGFVLHLAFILATTLWCTLLIIYRIVAVARRLRTYRHVIEVFVESSALYSLSLILYVAVFCYDTPATFYVDVVAGVARGIAPTLLVGRVAAGQARPDDSWRGSIMSSLQWRRSQQGSDDQLERGDGDEYAVVAASTAYLDEDDVTHRDHCKTQLEGLPKNPAVISVPRD